MKKQYIKINEKAKGTNLDELIGRKLQLIKSGTKRSIILFCGFSIRVNNEYLTNLNP